MSLQEKLKSDLLEAVRGRDEVRRSVLRLLRAGIQNEEIAKRRPLKEEEVLDLLSREAKRHKESIAEFRKGNRLDLVEREEAELALLLEYMPRQMSPEEILEVARQVMGEVGAQGPGDRGKVMGRLMPQLKGRADGKEVSQIVGELLSALSE
ncbi:MAG: GatB/YqeY domain-containing protein [Dehalococcoidia bacterium]